MNTLYSMRRLGNSYKVRLALEQLQIPYRLVEVDILRGESRTPEFLAKNPSGQVPLLEVAPGALYRRIECDSLLRCRRLGAGGSPYPR
jgi:glutathione S-transferase